jgi:hypothetical protein
VLSLLNKRIGIKGKGVYYLTEERERVKEK